jgi:potassium-transporting ATPase KdpC subunit
MSSFLQQIVPSLRMLLVMTLLTGALYPALVTLAGSVLFPVQAAGSLVYSADGQIAGSALIGQANEDPRYFTGRPSASAYGAVPSGASNAGSTNAQLVAAVRERTAAFRTANGLAEDALLPIEMLFASGSGLDPHISPIAALAQVERVATARGLGSETVVALVTQQTEERQFGLLGGARVNVLLLNLALDGLQ